MEPDIDSENPSESRLAELSEAELLRHWKIGTEQAAAILMERYSLRLVSLVASRLNRRFRGSVDPEEVVQSAMGSFFAAARQSRVHVSQSVSLWHLLATFAKRKMLRSIERQSAVKRGGDFNRLGMEAAVHRWAASPVEDDSNSHDDWLATIAAEIPADLRPLLDRLLAGQTQAEIAASLNLSERTVRRHVVRLREMLSPGIKHHRVSGDTSDASQTLPRIDYRQFVLGKLVGAGGFGKVYRAAMQVDGSLVAVKFLRKNYWHDAKAKQSFLREIDQASQIDHKSIVRYLGWGQSPHGGPYVVAQWVDGTTLAEGRSVAPERFVDYLRQICEALAAVHKAGIVHGDLTPSNILIAPPSQILITDFGFSRAHVPHDESAIESARADAALGGTLGFAAPEQVSQAFGNIGPKTDIYAVGGLAYWYVTGRPPHDKGSVQASLEDTIALENIDIAEQSLPSPSLDAIARVATAALRKSMAERPSSIQTSCADLRLNAEAAEVAEARMEEFARCDDGPAANEG